ncbi:MAG: Holliday junction resolvase RuvX [Patescibacteria group bacterium]
MAIDYGTKRIGAAIGEMIPTGLPIILNEGEKAVLRLLEIIEREEISAIVVGLPTRSQGEEGTISPEIREFARKLSEQAHKPVFFEPEELTSMEAESMIKQNNLKYAVDELAAVLILEQFINRVNHEGYDNLKPDIGVV